MRDQTRHNLRVGALALVALAVLGLAILNVGRRQQLFVRHTRYETSFRNVTGLQVGAPVQLSGVTVGYVERIELPVDPAEQRISVRFTLDAAYTERIREDTKVRIKTVGLLGDKFLEIRGGTPEADRVNEGGLVTGVDPAEVAEFVATGGDLMENLVTISSSLKTILKRVEAGEGLLGELTSSAETGQKLSESLQTTISTLNRILARVEAGDGLMGRLVADDAATAAIIDDLGGSLRSIRAVADTIGSDLERDDTAYAAILRDPEGARLWVEAIIAVRDGSAAAAAAIEELASGEGTLPRLFKDEDYADSFLDDLEGLVSALRSAADKIDQGTGSAGAFVNDPQLYEDLEHVVRGVKESKVTSWFIRNRRKKGEKLEAKEEAAAAEHGAGEP